MEKLAPHSADLKKDSIFQRSEKVSLIGTGKQSGDVHLFLFTDCLICGKKNVVTRVKSLTKPSLKMLFMLRTKDIRIKKGQKSG